MTALLAEAEVADAQMRALLSGVALRTAQAEALEGELGQARQEAGERQQLGSRQGAFWQVQAESLHVSVGGGRALSLLGQIVGETRGEAYPDRGCVCKFAQHKSCTAVSRHSRALFMNRAS